MVALQTIKISEQGETRGATELFAFRPSESNKEILDKAFKGWNLEDAILTQIDFKDPQTGEITKITGSLTKTNGKYLIDSKNASAQDALPGKDDQIVGVSHLTTVNGEDFCISIYRNIDSFHTAIEASKGQVIRIYSNKHDSNDYLINGINKHGIVSAIPMDYIGDQQEVSFKITGDEVIFDYGTDFAETKKLNSVRTLKSQYSLKAEDPKEGLSPTLLPVSGLGRQTLSPINALELIRPGTEITLRVKGSGLYQGESQKSTTWQGLKDNEILVGDPKSERVTSYDLKDVLEITTKKGIYDQQELEANLRKITPKEKREAGSISMDLNHQGSGRKFDFREDQILFQKK